MALTAMSVDGQPSVYLPVLKQGGDSNTITACARLKDGRLRATPPGAPCRRKEEALDWLEMAIKAGFSKIDHLRKDPDLDSLRNEKRYKKLLADR